MTCVALIPARGGSKSIPHKNIKLMCGMPLLYWACKAAEECDYVDEVYVSTNDAEIHTVAEGLGLGKLRVIGRPPETATDEATTESVMIDFAHRVKFDQILLLQATSPLVEKEDLNRAFELYSTGVWDTVLSVVRQQRFIWRLVSRHGWQPENYVPHARPRRQDFEGFRVENGAIYLTSRRSLLFTGCRIGKRVGVVTMPPDTYMELDDPEDWGLVEYLLRRRLSRRKQNLGKVRLVGTDIDGVLTDSGMYYGTSGEEMKKYSTRDGHGFQLLREAGIETVMITGEDIEVNRRRAKKLHAEIHSGIKDKIACMEGIMAERDLSWDQVAYIGDDLNDVPLLLRAGSSAAPADASKEVQEIVGYVTAARGGGGAFREFADLIVDVQRG